MASNRIVSMQLVAEGGNAIAQSGGEVMICTAGTPRKISLVDSAGAALSNPVSLTRGQFYAEVPKANTTVDLYVRSPTGHFRAVKGVTPGDRQSFYIPTRELRTSYIVPFSFADCTPATEKDSGFDLATDAQVLPESAGIFVAGTDAGITLDAGILSTESGGDANGFLAAISVATAGMVKGVVSVSSGVVVSASSTLGALIADITNGTNADDRGFWNKKAYRCDGTAKSISYTISTGADTGEGFIILPVELGGAAAQQSATN